MEPRIAPSDTFTAPLVRIARIPLRVNFANIFTQRDGDCDRTHLTIAQFLHFTPYLTFHFIKSDVGNDIFGSTLNGINGLRYEKWAFFQRRLFSYISPSFHFKIKIPSFTSNWRRILGNFLYFINIKDTFIFYCIVIICRRVTRNI